MDSAQIFTLALIGLAFFLVIWGLANS